MVRPGGRVVLLEFLRPERPRLFFDRIYNAHVLPLIGWVVSGDREAYRYLPDSIAPLPLAAPSWRRCCGEVGFARGRDQGAVPVGRRDDGGGVVKLVVAVGGASGSVYAKRLLDALAAAGPERWRWAWCSRSAGNEVWAHEIGDVPAYPFKRYGLRDFRAPFASGSAGWDAMVVIPCSTGGLARIAHGISDDLVGRAADVMLKERRKLVLVVRETPLSAIHLENMLAVTRAGAVVLPAVAVVLLEARDAGCAARHRGRARARPARAGEQADAPLGRRRRKTDERVAVEHDRDPLRRASPRSICSRSGGRRRPRATRAWPHGPVRARPAAAGRRHLARTARRCRSHVDEADFAALGG